MEQVLSVLSLIAANLPAILTAIVGIISGIIVIALLIPGDQPEKTLQKILDLLSKLSIK